VIEITEQHVDAPTARPYAQSCRVAHRGVRFAVDEFGTGYSSLNYLHSFPLDLVKSTGRSYATWTVRPSHLLWSRRSSQWGPRST